MEIPQALCPRRSGRYRTRYRFLCHEGSGDDRPMTLVVRQRVTTRDRHSATELPGAGEVAGVEEVRHEGRGAAGLSRALVRRRARRRVGSSPRAPRTRAGHTVGGAIGYSAREFSKNLRIAYGFGSGDRIGGRVAAMGGVFGVPHPLKSPPFCTHDSGARHDRTRALADDPVSGEPASMTRKPCSAACCDLSRRRPSRAGPTGPGSAVRRALESPSDQHSL